MKALEQHRRALDKIEANRRQWAISELMVEFPDLSEADAIAIYGEVIGTADEELEGRKRLAFVAASQAGNALADLLRFATEGPALSGFTFDEDVVELLLDAAKIAIMVTKDPQDADILVAINERLEGCA